MEPKKNIKKHQLTEPKWEYTFTNNELLSRILQASNEIQRNTLEGRANWVIFGSETARQFNEAMRDYRDIEVGDWRIEDDRYVQDITIVPNRSIEYLDLNITITGDTWTEI